MGTVTAATAQAPTVTSTLLNVNRQDVEEKDAAHAAQAHGLGLVFVGVRNVRIPPTQYP
jgi:hypothetical protein